MHLYCKARIELDEGIRIDFKVYVDDSGAVTHVYTPELDMPSAAVKLIHGKDIKPYIQENAKLLEYFFVVASITPHIDYILFLDFLSWMDDKSFVFPETVVPFPVLSPDIYAADALKYQIAQYSKKYSYRISSFFYSKLHPNNFTKIDYIDEPFFIDILKQFIHSPSQYFRKYCLYYMLRANDPETLTMLRRQLWSKNKLEVLDALYWIDVYRDEWASYRLHQLAINEDIDIKLAAILAIGNLRMSESIIVLYKLRMDNDDQEVGHAIAIAFQKMDDARILNLHWKEPPIQPNEPLKPLVKQSIFRTPIAYFPTTQYDYFADNEHIELAKELNVLHTYTPNDATEILRQCLQVDHPQLYSVACRLIEARKEILLGDDLFLCLDSGQWLLNDYLTLSALVTLNPPKLLSVLLKILYTYSEKSFSTQQIIVFVAPKGKSLQLVDIKHIRVIMRALQKMKYDKEPLISLLFNGLPNKPSHGSVDSLTLIKKTIQKQIRLDDTANVFEEFAKDIKNREELLQITMLMDAETTIHLLGKQLQKFRYTHIDKADLLKAIASLNNVQTLPLLHKALKNALNQAEKDTIQEYINSLIP